MPLQQQQFKPDRPRLPRGSDTVSSAQVTEEQTDDATAESEEEVTRNRDRSVAKQSLLQRDSSVTFSWRSYTCYASALVYLG